MDLRSRPGCKKKDRNLLARLGEKYRLRAFVFDGPDGVRGHLALARGRRRNFPIRLRRPGC